jgi:2-polyprenyl-3-methyl-5-hydroxy-6-metoxy-1,4-benzoquinol methylase
MSDLAQTLRACPVCGASDAQPYLRKLQLQLVRCQHCSMIYANPVPKSLISGEFYEQSGESYYLSGPKLEADYANVRFDRELRLFRRHCPAGSVLDVGCSSGAFLYQLNRRFPGSYQIFGTDVSGPALNYAESAGVPVIRGDFLRENLAGQHFDAVSFWAVLEHLIDPKPFLEKAWSLLNPGGLCFILVPNMDSLAVRLLGERYRYILPQHVNYFTRPTLMHLIQPRFEIVECRTTHFNPIVIWQDWRRKKEAGTDRERAALLKKTTAYKQNPILMPLRLLYGGVEKVLGLLGLADNLVVVLRKRS